MVNWIAHWLQTAGEAVTQWIVPKGAVNFDVVAGIVSIAVLALVVGVVALWPRRG